MRPEAVQIIRDEHLAIAAVLYCLRHHAQQVREEAKPADFALLRAILDYIVSYPDRWHHPKEDDYLFAAVRKRTREADALIAHLEREHREGYPLIARLKKELVAYQEGKPDAAARFFAGADRYIDLEWAHMGSEEDLLLPIAERVLAAEDWEAINRAFRENDNPLFGIKPKEEAELLYQRILALAPSGIGARD